MKKSLLFFAGLLFYALSGLAQEHFVFRGKILNDATGQPVPFCLIALPEHEHFVFSNAQGEFEIRQNKLPLQLQISAPHFKTKTDTIEAEENQKTFFLLSQKMQNFLAQKKPENLIEKASESLKKIKEEIEIFTAFFQEEMLKNSDYEAIAEASIAIEQGKASLLKGRKSLNDKVRLFWDYFRGDESFARLMQANPAKKIPEFLNARFFQFYTYKIAGKKEFQNRTVIVIDFFPAADIKLPLYRGELFLDSASFAPLHLNYTISQPSLKYAHPRMFVPTKPLSQSAKVLNFSCNVNFRFSDPKPLLATVSTEISMLFAQKDSFTFRQKLFVFEKKQVKNQKTSNEKLFSFAGGFDKAFWQKHPRILPSFSHKQALLRLNPPSDFGQALKKRHFSGIEPSAETIALCTDRNTYFLPDTLWFKAWLRNRQNAYISELSHEICFVLLNSKNEIVKKSYFSAQQGKSLGQIALPAFLPQGEYTILVFSEHQALLGQTDVFCQQIYLKNSYSLHLIEQNSASYSAGDSVVLLFDVEKLKSGDSENLLLRWELCSGAKNFAKGKTREREGKILIESVLPDTLTSSPLLKIRGENFEFHQPLPYADNQHVEVDFFAESGLCLAAKKNRFFVRAKAQNRPLACKIGIFNEQGEKIKNIATNALGLGSFELFCLAGKRYHARIDSPKVFENQNFDLPLPQEKGIAISLLSQGGKKLKIKILQASEQAKTVFLAALWRQELHRIYQLSLPQDSVVEIPVKSLPAGVLQLWLLNSNFSKLAERPVFVQPQKKLRIDILPEKKQDIPGEKQVLTVKISDFVGNPIQTSFALKINRINSISGESRKTPDWISALWLGAETSGNIPPGDYFGGSKKSRQALDWLLQTQNMRETAPKMNFSRKQVFRGRVLTLSGKRGEENAKILVFSTKNHKIAEIQSDKQGFFEYALPPETGLHELFFVAKDAKGNENVQIVADSVAQNAYLNFLLRRKPYLTCFQSVFSEKKSSFFPQGRFIFRKKQITENHSGRSPEHVFAPFSGSSKKGSNLFPATNFLGLLRQVETPRQTKTTRHGEVQVFFRLALPGARSPQPALFVLDGMEIGFDAAALNHLKPSDIDKIMVLKDLQAVSFGYLNAKGGAVLVETRQEKGRAEPNRQKHNILIPRVQEAPCEFVFPGRQKQFLVWQPRLQTNENGECRVEFVPPHKGWLKIQVHALSPDGLPGYGEIFYEIDQKP